MRTGSYDMMSMHHNNQSFISQAANQTSTTAFNNQKKKSIHNASNKTLTQNYLSAGSTQQMPNFHHITGGAAGANGSSGVGVI
jgi:hypothetical protein